MSQTTKLHPIIHMQCVSLVRCIRGALLLWKDPVASFGLFRQICMHIPNHPRQRILSCNHPLHPSYPAFQEGRHISLPPALTHRASAQLGYLGACTDACTHMHAQMHTCTQACTQCSSSVRRVPDEHSLQAHQHHCRCIST